MTLDEFSGINAGYVLELYERFRADPQSVDEKTRALFATWTPTELPPADRADGPDIEVAVAAREPRGVDPPLRPPCSAARSPGHTTAGRPVALDAVARHHRRRPEGASRLARGRRGGGELAERVRGDREAASRVLFEHRASTTRTCSCPRNASGCDPPPSRAASCRRWIRRAARRSSTGITQVDVFERFLHRTFPGKTRFSIEGLDMLVPMLDEIMAGAAGVGTRHTLVGMAHRGRLNVLAHVLDKPYAQILAEFKDPIALQTLRLDVGWMGDVKYHAGASTAVPHGQMFVTLVPNPSHLEAVNPVVVGMARAAGTAAGTRGAPHFDGAKTLPVLIHGDMAFPGQGIVAETLNLSRLPGYHTDGTLHIIANNQLGFTATPGDSYSTSYASGLARGFKIPIVHVNADDPVACLEAARTGVGISGALPARLPDRPRGLPAIRPQRGRRAGLHAARDVSRDRIAPHGAGAVCAHAGGARDGAGKRRRGPGEEALPGPGSRLRVAEAGGGLRGAAAPAGSGGYRQRDQDRRAAGPAARPEPGAAVHAPGVHRPPEAGAAAANAGG